MNINEEGKYYASMVHKFRTEYKSKNLHGFCKEQKVSYAKMLHSLRNDFYCNPIAKPVTSDVEQGFHPLDEASNELMKYERVKLTPARAMLLYMLCSLVSEGEFASEFAAEKLAYFLQKFGAKDSLKLHFRQYYYGPYSGKVISVLHYLNGSYLKGIGQIEQKPFDPIWLSPNTFKDVQNFFANEENKCYEDICKKTASFLSGFYSNYLLELLSTVDFILHNNEDLKEWLIMKPQKVFELVILHINQWSERKKYLFCDEEYVRLVLNHLYKFEK